MGEGQATAQGDLNKNGHGTCVCKKEKLDTTGMSSSAYWTKILVHQNQVDFTSGSEKKVILEDLYYLTGNC